MLEHDINPERKRINEWVVLDNGRIVHRYSLCFSSLIGYEVYEATESPHMFCPFYSHSTITLHDDYGCLGKMTTRNLPDRFARLSGGSSERITAVEQYYAELEEEAACLIRLAFPQDFEQGHAPPQ